MYAILSPLLNPRFRKGVKYYVFAILPKNTDDQGAPAAWFVRMEELSPIWAAFDCGVREKFSFSEPYSIRVWKRIEGEAPSEHRFI